MFWNKKVATTKEREWKELLRENMGTIVVDMFYGDDPILLLGPEDRKLYLKKFHELMKDPDVIKRFHYLANKQANLTLKYMRENSKIDGETDMAGAMNINGICVVKEDFERLGTMFSKEESPPEDFNPYAIIGV